MSDESTVLKSSLDYRESDNIMNDDNKKERN